MRREFGTLGFLLVTLLLTFSCTPTGPSSRAPDVHLPSPPETSDCIAPASYSSCDPDNIPSTSHFGFFDAAAASNLSFFDHRRFPGAKPFPYPDVASSTVTGRWRFDPWCGSRANSRSFFNLSRDDLLRMFRNKTTVFVGDSVVRNSFVMTVAKLCNNFNRLRCHVMLPTFEYDIIRAPGERGPMGCIPGKSTSTEAPTTMAPDGADLAEIAASLRRRDEETHRLSSCYEDGKFAFVPVPGLTSLREPANRKERARALAKGTITPLIHARIYDFEFWYVPVKQPKEIHRFASFVETQGGASGHPVARGDLYIFSTGPHVKLEHMPASTAVLSDAFRRVRAALPAAIMVALEPTHHILTPAWALKSIDEVAASWRTAFAPHNVTVIPQRFISAGAYFAPWRRHLNVLLDYNESSPIEELFKVAVHTGNSASVFLSLVDNLGSACSLSRETEDDENSESLENENSPNKPGRIYPVGGRVGERTALLNGWMTPPRSCEYYDLIHPSASCQDVLTDIQLAVIASLFSRSQF